MKHLEIFWRALAKNDRDSRTKVVVDTLHENILFRGLSRSELRLVARVLHHRSYQKGELIFRKGERGFGLYIVIRGSVDIVAENQELGQFRVTTLGPGNFFGELALVDENSLRSATAVATEGSELVGFFKPDLMDIIDRYPATGVKILYELNVVLGHRLVDLIEEWTKAKPNSRSA